MKPCVVAWIWQFLIVCLTLEGNLTGIALAEGASPVSTLYQEGEQLEKTGNYPAALTSYEAGLKAAEKSANKQAAANGWLRIGRIKMKQEDRASAMQAFDRSRKIAEELNDQSILAQALVYLGDIHTRLGQYKEAQENYERALAAGEKAKDSSTMSLALIGIGTIHSRQGRYGQAIEQYQRALKMRDALGDRRGIAEAIHDIGVVYTEQGSYSQAVEHYQRALRILEEIGDKIGIAAVLNGLGVVNMHRGAYRQAVEHFQKALKIREERGDQRELATILNNLGVVYSDQAAYGRAIEHFQRALRTREELGDKRGSAETINNIGAAYRRQGLYDKAIEHYQRALKMREELGDKKGIANTLNNIAVAYQSQGLYGKALAYHQRALKIKEEIGDRPGVAFALNGIGKIYWTQGSYEAALEHFQRALKISQEIKANNAMGYALNWIGDVYTKQQKYSQAMEVLQQALALGEEIKEPTILTDARFGLASAYEKLGQLPRAIENYQLAIEAIEKMRAGSSSDAGKVGFLQDKTHIYKRVCALLLRLHDKEPAHGYDKQALAYAEKARARALVDSLAEGLANLNKRLSPELEQKEKDLLAGLSRAHQKLQRRPSRPEREALIAEIKRLEAEHDQLKEEVRRQDPTYASLAYPQPYTLDQIRKNILDDETALLEYLLDADQSLVYLVSRKELAVKRLPARSQIEKNVTAFLDGVKSAQEPRSEVAALQMVSQQLYQDLLAPLAAPLSRYPRLIIAADGPLYYLPFEALGSSDKTGFRYFIEDHVISYAPSATVLGELLARSPHRAKTETLLALGDPDFGKERELAQSVATAFTAVRGWYDTQFNLDRLPFTGEEVQEIARHFRGSVVRVRRDASEEYVKQAPLENYRIIHFATHGLLDERNPQASCLVLSLADPGAEDGFLQVREIYDLRLNADLIVLSACNTGRGRLISGEGVLGLHRAFFYAGARSVLGSLWSINDRASSDLMSQFYYHLQKGKGKAEALREAKLKFLRSRTHAHPYYWAAFVLQGEPRESLFVGLHWVRWLLVFIVVLPLPLVLKHLVCSAPIRAWLRRRPSN